ncbi:hypothetical protein [Candidatus Neomicrothrix sp.]|nr:hypothetical protein [Candidatus Microthrix sp.]
MNEPVYLFSRIAFRHDIDEADTLHAPETRSASGTSMPNHRTVPTSGY